MGIPIYYVIKIDYDERIMESFQYINYCREKHGLENLPEGPNIDFIQLISTSQVSYLWDAD
jgi:hypothetical protein